MTLLSKIRETVSALAQPLNEPLDVSLELEAAAPAERRSCMEARFQFCRVLLDERYRSDLNRLAKSWRQLEECMALVPAGATRLGFLIPDENQESRQEMAHQVEAHYIDRYAVTNEQFAEFVDDGGYDREEFWPVHTLPYLLQFVDQTGTPSPKFWQHGRPPADKQQHPVVGVSWYEAQAFGMWAGRGLPPSAVWQHAGSWFSVNEGPPGASYPWGNVFNPAHANTWHGGRDDTVEVTEFREGATPSGVYQLIGNVWEWTACQLDDVSGGNAGRLVIEQPMAEVRGGAYDTYFETQATCQFRTGHQLLYRGPNVGFRCCVPLRNLPARPDPSAFMMENPV